MSSFVTNNLRDLYLKQQQMPNGSEVEADEAAINQSGFTFYAGKSQCYSRGVC